MKIYLSENDYYFDNKGEPVPAITRRRYEKLKEHRVEALITKKKLALIVLDVKELEEELEKEKEKTKGMAEE